MLLLSLVSRNLKNFLLISSVTYSLSVNVLFNLDLFVFFTAPPPPLYLIPSFTASWSEKMLDMISIFFSLLRLDL